MGYFSGTSRDLPDQPAPAVDPEVERLVHVLVDGLIARLAAEPATPAASLLENLGDQLHQAANLRRLGVVHRTSGAAVLPVAVGLHGASTRSQSRDSDGMVDPATSVVEGDESCRTGRS